jgi:nucleotide-binding universal stress UspA family protein
MKQKQNRIMVAIDYSRQSIDAARYISAVLRPFDTAVVLFNIISEHIDITFDYEKKLPHNVADKSRLSDFMEIKKRDIYENLEQARTFFLERKFPKDHIRIIKTPLVKSIARDILAESQKGYDLLVTGKSGINRVSKDLSGTTTEKLFRGFQHIPMVIVSGIPETRNLLVGYQEDRHVTKPMELTTRLLTNDIDTIQFCHLIKVSGLSFSNGKTEAGSSDEKLRQTARRFFEGRGFTPSKFLFTGKKTKGSRVEELMAIARSQGYGTVVFGRRKNILAEELFEGSVEKKFMMMAKSCAVWIV